MKKDLELIIDQPVVGHFYWTIVSLGAPGDLPRVMDYAHGPMPTHNAARVAGTSALRLHQAEAAKGCEQNSQTLAGMRADCGATALPGQLH